MSERLQKVNQLIQKEISRIILKEVEFPSGALVTITRVEASPNLTESKVFVSVFPDDKSKIIIGILNKSIYNLQQKLNKRLNMRPLPRLIFVVEEMTKEAGQIEEILAGLKKEKK